MKAFSYEYYIFILFLLIIHDDIMFFQARTNEFCTKEE